MNKTYKTYQSLQIKSIRISSKGELQKHIVIGKRYLKALEEVDITYIVLLVVKLMDKQYILFFILRMRCKSYLE